MFMAALMLTGCSTVDNTVLGTDGKPLPKAEAQKVIKNTIASKVENRDFRILVDEMDPLRGPSLHLRDNDWALEVHGDSIGSVLPYVGRGYNVPYGSAMGLHFITRIDSYSVQQTKPGRWDVNIRCHTPMESYNYNVEVFDNGQAYISVVTRYRDAINFSGNVDLNGLSLKRVK